MHPGVTEAFSRGCNWLSYVLLPFWLTASEFGRFSFVLALVLLVSAISTAGQDRAILRFVSGGDIRSRLRTTAALFISVLFALFCLACVRLLVETTSILPDYNVPWSLVLIWIGLQMLCLLIAALSRALNDNNAFAVVRGIYGASKLVCLNLVAAQFAEIESVIWTEVTLLALVTLFAVFRFRQHIFAGPSIKVAKQSLLFGMPLVLHVLAGASLGQLDKLMIGNMLDATSLGLYAFLNSLASGVFFVFAVFNITYETRIYQSKDAVAAESMMSDMLKYSVGIAMVLLAAVNIGLSPLLIFLDKAAYFDAHVLAILSVAYLVYPLYLQANVRFIHAKQTRWIPLMTGLAALVNVAANLILIPLMGIQGAAWSTLLSYAVLVMFAQFTSRRIA